MKKAFLVEVALRTRVEVDIPDNFDLSNTSEADEVVLDAIGISACKRLTGFVLSGEGNPICLDNVVEIEEDYEMPYGEYIEDDDCSMVGEQKEIDSYCDEFVYLLLGGKEPTKSHEKFIIDKTKCYVKDDKSGVVKLVDIDTIGINTTKLAKNHYVHEVVFYYTENDVRYEVHRYDMDLMCLYQILEYLRIKAEI